MDFDIEQLLERVEQQRTQIIRRITNLSSEEVTWKPDARTWSIQQVLEHLVLVDEILGRPQIESRRGGLPSFLIPVAGSMVRAALRINIKVPIPSQFEPQGNIPVPDLLIRWQVVTREMRRELAAGETRYRQIVLGAFTPRQMLGLMEAHTAYHSRQIEELMKNFLETHPNQRPGTKNTGANS